MIFSHREDPSRTATIEPKPDSPTTFVAHHTDAKGKARKKSFKAGYAAALRFLLNKEGYILRGPQDGPIRWMSRLLMNYYGEIGHGLDVASGRVWVVGPEDHIHRFEPDSCVCVSAPLQSGDRGPGGEVVAGAQGSAWVLSSTWAKVDGELERVHRLARVSGEEELQVDEILRHQGGGALGSLSASAAGLVLGPDPEGAALYDAEGQVLERWACASAAEAWHGAAPSPLGAISRSGAWIVLTEAGGVRRIQRETGTSERLEIEFKTVNGLQIADDGRVFVSGYCYPSHGLYLLGAGGGQVRVSDDIRATIRADGSRFIEAEAGSLTLCESERESEDEMELRHVLAREWLPALGMAKYGRAEFGAGGEVVVLTDAYTLACVRLGSES